MGRFVGYIRNRLHKQNRNYLCAIVGPTGSGKSYSALRLAEQVDSGFNMLQVVFTPQEFMALLNSGTLKRGSVIVFDEAGVAVNSRNFQTATNKLLHFITQTFRSMNYCVIYTCPDFTFLDKGIRKLVHSILETKKIDYEKELVWVRPLMVENNPQSGRIYMKFPRFHDEAYPRMKVAITKMYFHKPSPELIEAYEDRKLSFNKKLQLDVEATLNKDEAKGQPQEIVKSELQAIYDSIAQNPQDYLTQRGSLNEGKIALDFGIGGRKIDRLKQLFSIKGHTHALYTSSIKQDTNTHTKQV